MSKALQNKKEGFRPENALHAGLSEFWLKIYEQFISELSNTWQAKLKTQNTNSTTEALLCCLELLFSKLSYEDQQLTALRNRHRIFVTEVSQETDQNIKHKLILEFCQFLGASNLRNDKKALNRWLDENAVTERWQSKVKDREFYVNFLMGRIATIFDHIAFSNDRASLPVYWQKLNIEKELSPWIHYAFEPNIQLSAFRCLSSILKSLHQESGPILSPELQRYTYRFALDNRQKPELQVESLHLLAVADVDKAISLIKTRLARQEDQEQIFFKEAIAEVICLYCLVKPELLSLVDDLVNDESPLVKQSAVQILNFIDDDQKVLDIAEKLSNDESDAVYCQLVTHLPYYLGTDKIIDFYLARMTTNLSLLRTRALCLGLLRCIETLAPKQLTNKRLLSRCEKTLCSLAMQDENPQKQYIATQTKEKIWARAQIQLSSTLAPLLDQVQAGEIKLSKEQAEAISSVEGKRWLAANIGHRFSIQIGKTRIHSGERFKFRWWRFFYELFRPATDKRQHHSHITGRIYYGDDFIPSASLAELSATTVPGEPLHLATDGHWRPFLPLVDQLISSLAIFRRAQPITLYHVGGMTRIVPPQSLLKKLSAKCRLTARFKYYSDLRNVDFNSSATSHYARAIRNLGFTLEHQGYTMQSDSDEVYTSPYVARFFELAVPLSVIQFYQDFQRYFVSVYQNTIQHILIFTLALIGIFWGNHVVLSRRVKKARRQIPMTIGGWGTRGKSGTERLKAALVNSQGLATVSKTTGCEAMFLFSTRYGQLKEMFLFRPYDKATIWEQTFVTRLAAKLKSDVLCWECMGLTPRYIDILQQQWMKDDFVTITNCFPDHEDLQGPAGIDIPQVIARFIAPDAKVWTTEENMLAYLEKEAQQKQAELTAVNWLDVATIPEDLLSRFPYQEHPANIALVAKLASEIQIPRSWAIKEMADRVVPDIGVLQTFPFSNISQRRMRFINGMSANERYGALANWQRLKYDDTERFFKGDFQLVTVVNNRADRVPRSKIFARLIAWDFPALKHFIIGDNLDGFRMFASDAWQERLNTVLIDNSSAEEYCDELDNLMRFLLIPDSDKTLLNALFIAIPEFPRSTDLKGIKTQLRQLSEESGKINVSTYFLELVENYQHYQQLKQEAHLQNNKINDLISKTKSWLSSIFMARLQLVDDYHITGDRLNSLIAHAIPEGINTDILGLQNIKGPGLDFVYAWQQWGRTHQLIRASADNYGESCSRHIRELIAQPTFNCLEKQALLDYIDTLESGHGLAEDDRELLTGQLRAKVLQCFSDDMYTVNDKQLLRPVLGIIEDILDIFDAVVRGRKAQRILVDLAAQRISLNKAANLLMQINKRQKGGWFMK